MRKITNVILLIMCMLMTSCYLLENTNCVHEYILSNKVEPTCQQEGMYYYLCGKCDKSLEQVKAKVEHEFIAGYCKYCNLQEKVENQECQHNYEDELETIPTCEQEGLRRYTCKICNDTYTEKVEKIEHEFVNGYCKYCKLSETPEPVECEHIYEIVSQTNSTCLVNGIIRYECSNCDSYYEEEKTLNDHLYIGGFCCYCEGNNPKYDDSIIYDIFGKNTNIYENDEQNPYNIDLSKYGSNVSAVFYTPKYESMNDPYINISYKEFYENYNEATSVEDAYYRTKHHFISGDIEVQGHIPPQSNVKEKDSHIRCISATYVLSPQGDYLAYIPNDLDGDLDYIIYYGAGYQSINDVAAYLLAFGEVPANNKYDKSSGKKQSVNDWGIYGRVNNSSFSGDTSKYPYEPLLPGIGSLKYIETDFGTEGGYTNYNSITGTKYTQTVYNNGSSISRGAARFVFVSNSSTKNIDKRYVFYTYNHYNDFQEYLNYNDGFGLRFGNESAGNEYCGNNKDYNSSNKFPLTKYPQVILKEYDEIISN